MLYLGVFRLEFEKKTVVNFQYAKRRAKQIFKFGTKNALTKHFWAAFLKNCCYIWRQHPRHEKSRAKQRFFKFGTSNDLFGYFWAAILKKLLSKCRFLCKTKRKSNLGPIMFCLGIFTLKLEKTIVISEFSTLRFAKMQKFMQNKNFSNLGLKMPYLGIFG